MPDYNTITVVSKKDAEIMRLNRRVLDESPDLIAIIDTRYVYSYVNPRYVSSHEVRTDELVGRHVEKFLGKDAFEDVVKPKLQKCFDGEDIHYEEWFDFPSMGVKYMDVRYLPLRNRNKTIDRVAIILRDITYKKDSEEARLNGEKLKTIVDLAATYNHEINNPLCSLSGYLQLLQGEETDDKKRHYLDKAMEEVGRISDVTRKISEATSFTVSAYPGGENILEVTHGEN